MIQYRLTITTRNKPAVFEPVTFETFGVLHNDGTEEKRFGVFDDRGVLLDWTEVFHPHFWDNCLSETAKRPVTIRISDELQWKIERSEAVE